MEYKNILVKEKNKVGIIQLNRPDALNALCEDLMNELTDCLTSFENNNDIKVVILTGSEKTFAAGADIKEMAHKNFIDAYKEDFITRNWEAVTRFRKPIIAAVAGYCLGGGCELAMMCDFIIAADDAQFAQPEITVGTLPGGGGTQRLTRLIGKSKAMELCLTGRMLSADEAEKAGLVARVFPAKDLILEAEKIAEKIAGFSTPATMMVKEAINKAYETTLAEGIKFERRMFHASFATNDQKEGMDAFINKRKAEFKDS